MQKTELLESRDVMFDKREWAKRVVEEVKNAHPEPCENATWNNDAATYCVGSAFAQWMGVEENPLALGSDVEAIHDAIERANPFVPSHRILGLVREIWMTNDTGDIPGAWKALEDALAYPE